MLMEGIVGHHDCIGPLAQHRREGRFELSRATHFDRISTIPAAGAAFFISSSVATFEALSGIDEEGDATHVGDCLAQHLQPLGAESD